MLERVKLTVRVNGKVSGLRVDRHDSARRQAQGHRNVSVHLLASDLSEEDVVSFGIAVVAKEVVAHWILGGARGYLVVFGHRRIVLAIDDDGHRSLGSASLSVGHRVHEGLGSRLAVAERIILACRVKGILAVGTQLDRHTGGKAHHLADIGLGVLHRLDSERIALRIDVVGKDVVGNSLVLSSPLGVIVRDGRVVVAVNCNRHCSKFGFTVSIANGVSKSVCCCFTWSQRLVLICRIICVRSIRVQCYL